MRRGTAIAILAPVVGLLTTFTAATVGADTSDTRFQAVGTMPYGSLDGMNESQFGRQLQVDSSLHRATMVVPTTPPAVRVYDTKSRSIIGDVPVPKNVSSINDGTAELPAGDVDPATHRVIYGVGGAAHPCVGPAGSALPVFQTSNLAFFDLSGLGWKELAVPCLANGDPFGLKALTYVAAENAVYLFGYDSLYEQFEGSTNVQSWYLRKVDAASGKLDWEVRLAACDADWSSTAPASSAIVRRLSQFAYVTCDGDGNATSGFQQALLVKVPLDATGSAPAADATGTALNTTADPLVYQGFAVLSDPTSGLVVQLADKPAFGFGGYTFDPKADLFRGFVETSNDVDTSGNPLGLVRAAGLDPSLGRLYMRTQQGLYVSDIRHKPLPVALAYPDLADTFDWVHQAIAAGAGPRALSVDDSLHRLFIPDFTHKAFVVYDDTAPPTPDNPPAQPDQATLNQPEATGVTGATYSGSGDGYGVYVLSEGGPNRVMENAVLGQCPAPCPDSSVFSPGDRVMFLGHIADLSITNIGASASGAAAEAADGATAQDLQRAGVYGTNPPPAPGQPTPSSSPTPAANVQQTLNSNSNADFHFPVDRPVDRPTCSDFGSTPGTKSEQSAVGNAKVTCEENVPEASATATFDSTGAASASGIPDVGDYYSTVTSTRTPEQGVTTTVTSWARHITIAVPGAPVISIGGVKTTATTSAHGRPGTTTATFTRTITDVVTPTYQCTDPCDAQKVAAAITAVFSNAHIDAAATAPSPSQQATPGGYQGVITKNLDLAASDRAVNDDKSDAVAGLVITYYDDGESGKAREIFQFAGVHAESHYGIYLLASGPPPDLSTPPSGGSDDTGLLPVTPPLVNNQNTGASAVAPAKTPTKGPLAVLNRLADILHEGWRLLISDPKRAAMLAALWSLLLSPVYLAMRRRALVTTLFRGTA